MRRALLPATSVEAQQNGLSFVGPSPPESYAFAECWNFDSDDALPDDVCDQLVACTGRPRNWPERWRADNFDIFPEDIPAELQLRILDPFRFANEDWWQLDVTSWAVELKRYRPGMRIREHVDLAPGSHDEKIDGSWQLSDPDDYAGGELRVRISGVEFDAPIERGSGVCFPAWTPHLVEPVVDGERWSLVVRGGGPKPR